MRVEGLYVPVLTPLRRDGSLDLSAIRGHVDRLIAGGIDGIVALGTTGEFADLVGSERRDVIAAVVEAADRRVPVAAGIGGIGTAEAIPHGRAAEDAGADALLALPPLYWKLDDATLFGHFAAIAEHSSRPIVLYDFPRLSGTPLSPALVGRLVREVPQVVGIKLSGSDLRTVHAVLRQVKGERPDFAVMIGAADLVLAGLLAGADGTIAAIANVDPRPLVDLLAAVKAGDLEQARRTHARVLALLKIPALCNPPLLALKAAAAAFGSPIQPVVRTQPPDSDRVVVDAAELARSFPGA